MLLHVLIATLLLAALLFAGGQARAAVPPRVEVMLPSAEPSGVPENDQIWVTYYPAARAEGAAAPAVVMLHALGEERDRIMPRFARYLAARGIGSAVMTLPYHMRRRPPNEYSGGRFFSSDPDRLARAASQSAADVSAVVTWLSRQPGVDSQRIGVVGISLGAILAHLAMGKDERLIAGVALLGGGDLLELRRRSVLFDRRAYRRTLDAGAQALERLREADPLHYAGRNRPRRVLMVQAARDLFIPPYNARVLWEALGRPSIRWVDTNHFGPLLGSRSLMKASLAFLRTVWDDPRAKQISPPRLYAPTLKLGLLSGLDAAATLALQWQAITFARRRDQMSLLHLDLGWSGRGPFAGLAVTLNGFLDAGVARRFTGGSLRPYLSWHVVF